MHHASDKETGGGASCASHIALISNAESPATEHGNREKTEQPKGIRLSLSLSPSGHLVKVTQDCRRTFLIIMDLSRIRKCGSEVKKVPSIACQIQVTRRLSQGFLLADNSWYCHRVERFM
jgi:hypothetical protein